MSFSVRVWEVAGNLMGVPVYILVIIFYAWPCIVEFREKVGGKVRYTFIDQVSPVV